MWFRRNKRPREFKVGDRVKVKGCFPSANSYWLQRNSRIGTIVYIGTLNTNKHYYLHMDKPVKHDEWLRIIVDIPPGYAYFSTHEKELELLKPPKPQKPFKIWAIKPPKAQHKRPEQQIPKIWEKPKGEKR